MKKENRMKSTVLKFKRMTIYNTNEVVLLEPSLFCEKTWAWNSSLQL